MITHHGSEHPAVRIDSAAKARKKRKVNDDFQDDGVELDVQEKGSGKDLWGILDVADHLENDFHLREPDTVTTAFQREVSEDVIGSLLAPNWSNLTTQTVGVVDHNPINASQCQIPFPSLDLDEMLISLNDHTNTPENSIEAMESFNNRKQEPLITDLQDFDFFLENLDKYTHLEELHFNLRSYNFSPGIVSELAKKAKRISSLSGKVTFASLERLTLCEDIASENISLLSLILNLFKNTPKLEYLYISPCSLNGELFQDIKERGCFKSCRHLLVDLHIDTNLRKINGFISVCENLKTVSFKHFLMDDYDRQTIIGFVNACKGKDLRFIRSELVSKNFDYLPRTLSLVNCVWGGNVSDEEKLECFRKVLDKCSHLQMVLWNTANAVRLRDVLRSEHPAGNLKTIAICGPVIRSEVLHLMQFCKDNNVTATFE